MRLWRCPKCHVSAVVEDENHEYHCTSDDCDFRATTTPPWGFSKS